MRQFKLATYLKATLILDYNCINQDWPDATLVIEAAVVHSCPFLNKLRILTHGENTFSGRIEGQNSAVQFSFLTENF